MQTPERLFQWLGFNPTGDLAGWTLYTNKRGGVIWFPKSPPTKLRTAPQLRQWFRFVQAAQAWRSLTQGQKNEWFKAASRAHLYLSGYNLFVWWQLKPDVATLRTIARISGANVPTT